MGRVDDDVVDITVKMHADEDSARKAGKQLTKAAKEEIESTKKLGDLSDQEYDSERKLEKIKHSLTQLDSHRKKLLEQQKALKGQNTKLAREEKAELQAQLDLTTQKIAQKSDERAQENINLITIRKEIEATQELLAVKKNVAEQKSITVNWDRVDKDTAQASKFFEQEVAKMDTSTDKHMGNVRGNIRKTASQIKADIKSMISTFNEQPNKDFTKEENDNIKLLQEDLAKAKLEVKDLEGQFDEPFKLQVDIRDTQNELEKVRDEIALQSSTVDKLKQDYVEAKAKADELANAFQPGKYTTDELTFEMEKIKGAEDDAKAMAKSYDEAKVTLDKLIAKEAELGTKVEETSQKYQDRVYELKKDGHNEELITKNEELLEQYDEASDRVERLQQELQYLYKGAKENDLVKRQDLDTAKQIEETLKGIGNEIRNIQDTGSHLGVSEALKEEIELQEQAIKAKKKAVQEEINAARTRSTLTYRTLRSIKMLLYVINSADNKLDSLGKTALKTFESITKSVTKMGFSFVLLPKKMASGLSKLKQFVKEHKNLTKSGKDYSKVQKDIDKGHKLMNMSLKDLIKNVLKYGLGIRSLFVLFNKLRKAMGDGMENLATQWEEVNQQMSSVITSLFQMKNAVAAAVQPILTVLAPALEKVAAVVSDIAYKIASFIAALTGTTAYVYKAKRAQQQFVDKTEDATKALKDEKKELSALDKLNVLTTDKDKDKKKDTPVQDMFEKVPIDSTMKKWADKFKKWLKKFFEPFKKAWEREGKFVMDAWKKMVESVGNLLKDIARDFETVWTSETMVNVWANILHIIGDIFLFVGIIADKLREAWNHNKNGLRIFQSIAKILEIITGYLRMAADDTVEWAKSLTFVPLFDAIADVLESQIVPAIDKICNLLYNLYNIFILPLAKHFIEQTLPKLVKTIGNIIEAIGNIADNINKALTNGDRGKLIVESIERIVDTISDAIYDCSEYTKEWSKQLDFEPLVESIKDYLEDSEAPIKSIVNLLKDVYKNVILPLAKYIIEVALPNAFKVAGNINRTIGYIADNISKAFKENKRGERIIGTVKSIVEKIGKVIADCAEKTKEWAKNVDFGPLVEEVAKFLEKAEKPIGFIAETFGKFYTEVILPFSTYFIEKGLPKLLDTLGKIVDKVDWDKLREKVDKFLKAFEPFLEKVWESLIQILEDIGNAIATFVNSKEFENIINFIIDFMDNVTSKGMAKALEGFVIALIGLKAVVGLFSTVFMGWQVLYTILNYLQNKAIKDAVLGGAKSITAMSGSLDALKGSMTGMDVAAKGAQTAAETAAGTATTAAATAGKAAAAGSAAETAAGSAAAGASGAAAAATVALGVFDTVVVAYDVGKLVKVHKDWEKADDDHKTAVDNYCTQLEKLYHTAGQKAVQEVTGEKDSLGKLQKEIETASGQHKIELERKYAELNKVYEDAGNTAVSTVTGTNTTLKEAQADAQKEFADMPHNMWEGFKEGWEYYMGKPTRNGVGHQTGEGGGLSGLIKDAFTEMLNTGKAILGMDSGKTSTEAEDMGENTAQGYYDGFEETWSNNEDEIVDMFGEPVEEGKKVLQIESPSKVTEEMGKNTADGFLNGFKKSWGKLDFDSKFKEVIKKANKVLTSTALKTTGTNVVKGLSTGIKTAFGSVMSTVAIGTNNIKQRFRTGLPYNALVATGKNLINGLKAGLLSALNSALAAISNVCSKITAKAKAAFKEHSPSKVFAEIGKNLMLGLDKGMEDNTDEVTDSFDELVPSDKMLMDFYNRFMDIMSRLTNNVKDMFSDMFDYINTSLVSLSKVASINELNAKLSTMRTYEPDIVKGYQMPSNKNFSINAGTEVDLSKLPQLMKKAFIEAITETSNLQSDDGTIIVNIDGNKVFQAVRNENSRYKKQHGVSAFV